MWRNGLFELARRTWCELSARNAHASATTKSDALVGAFPAGHPREAGRRFEERPRQSLRQVERGTHPLRRASIGARSQPCRRVGLESVVLGFGHDEDVRSAGTIALEVKVVAGVVADESVFYSRNMLIC
jgi:hypothetical protein